ncbi:MAG: CDP-diacylglycerol--glycerol-3-phosphate 3-phosphatidyltransferase [Pseudobdellovibrionaceae bacterium]|nr:CDP-diacylglycerol--glycerol-3-phosphate 3-phosphatidyltransferase [Bdellovibrionales bacterium]USN48954.1 MAG: CDP-diacylglycerol--glycerol-3-phosphate 3-phosphatidyltransferase [Pseudobdellovibrionaceae bacterium]
MIATYARILMAPVLVAILMSPLPHAGLIAAVIFILTSITDWLDGYWARLYQAESAMGKFMDPIADKILVLTVLILLLDAHKVDPIMVILLLARDIFIGGLRSVAASNNVIIAAKPFGKWKTGFQMAAIPCLLVSDELFKDLSLHDIGYYGLWISVVLSLISGVEYTWGYYKNRPALNR